MSRRPAPDGETTLDHPACEARPDLEPFADEKPARERRLPDQFEERTPRDRVAVEEYQELPARFECGEVQSPCLPIALVRLPDVRDLEPLAPAIDDGTGTRPGTVVCDDDVERFGTLIGQSMENDVKSLGSLVGRKDDGCGDARRRPL